MGVDATEVKRLQEIARRCRLSCLKILESSGVGHNGGSMSVIDILVALFFHAAKTNSSDPDWPERDRIILSKAHASEGMYAVLGEAGFFPKEKFDTYGTFGSSLQGHTDAWATPGVEYSGGSLGQGLSFAIGIALGDRLRNASSMSERSFNVYCILGDGECQEGQVWEAAMSASSYKLGNVVAIIDYNKYCTIGETNKVVRIEPFAEKWLAFGWSVAEVDGHDFPQLVRALDATKSSTDDETPKCIIANTVKGKGVPLWEEKHAHNSSGEILAKGIEQGRRLLS